MNKTILTYTFFLSILLSIQLVFGQRDPNFMQIMYNTTSINPAYAGSQDYWSLTGSHKSQWVGISGSPTTQNLGIQGPLGNTVGLGFNLTNDALGPVNEILINGNFSYALKIDKEGRKFALGLKAGGRVLDVDFTQGETLGQDITFQNNIENQFFPTIGVGMFYYSPKSYFGISIPNLFSQEFYDESVQEIDTERIHFLFLGGTVLKLNKQLRLKPAVFVKWLPDEEPIMDISLSSLIKETLTIGLSYRYNNSISALAFLQISPRFYAGYNYDQTTKDLKSSNYGTHEIFLRFDLKSEKQALEEERFF
jgi:type IX secretion system PorP/SprF family membrane protein